ncbi:organelle RRM domain-containing protein 1, chloroplastic-like [Populus nigra]|nr:organelle RRM domain-containing protein 1, chloroplastic-like [Populus nigra]
MSWSLLLAGPSLSNLLVVYCSMSGHTFWERLNCRMSKGTTRYQGSAFKNVNERPPLSSCKLAPHQFVRTVKKKKMAQRIGLQLFVSRLSSYTTNHELKRLFSPFGAVSEARLVVESKTLRPKGFGFVTFESEADAHKALKAMNGRIVNGRLIFVEVAKDTER